MKPRNRRALVAKHLCCFEFVDHAVDQICFVASLSFPKRRLDVVLEQYRRRLKLSWKIQRRSEEIAHGDIKAIIVEQSRDLVLNLARCEFRYRVRRCPCKPPQII